MSPSWAAPGLVGVRTAWCRAREGCTGFRRARRRVTARVRRRAQLRAGVVQSKGAVSCGALCGWTQASSNAWAGFAPYALKKEEDRPRCPLLPAPLRVPSPPLCGARSWKQRPRPFEAPAQPARAIVRYKDRDPGPHASPRRCLPEYRTEVVGASELPRSPATVPISLAPVPHTCTRSIKARGRHLPCRPLWSRPSRGKGQASFFSG